MRACAQHPKAVQPLDMVDKSFSPCEGISRWMFVIGQSGQVTSSRSEAASECFCGHLHRLPRDL